VVFHLLHPRLQEAVRRLGYLEPTPAQQAAIPVILSGAHVLLAAPSGSGKTEAALFPVLSRMLSETKTGGAVRCLYITPLRSLNRDLLRRVYAVTDAIGVTVAVRHGDTTASERRLISSRPPDVLITTPESLQILLLHRKLRQSLRGVRYVIVDEVHELVNSKRGAQLALGLERLVELAGEFQRVGLSATVGAPELVAAFLGGVGRRVEVVSASAKKPYEINVVLPTPSDGDFADAERLDATPEAVARIKKVVELVRQAGGSVLVFTNTRDGAEFLASRLRKILGDVIEVHHSSLSREHRVSVEERLRRGELKAVVATSSLELGIDIGEIELVIQYGSPRQSSRLLQRVGRGGHKVGAISRGVIVALDFEDYLESKVIAERAARGELEADIEYHESALDVLLHQVVGMALEARLDGRELTAEGVMRAVRRAHPYRNVTEEDLRLVLDFAERHGLLRGLRPRRGSVKYYFENVSVIPDGKSLKAVDETTGRAVGELDEEFVHSLEPGARIVLSGRVWTLTRREGDVVYLYPDYDVRGAVPAWLGEQIPVPYEVAREVCARRAAALRDALASRAEVPVDLEGLAEDLIPKPGMLHIHVVERRYAVIHSCLGSRGNEALGMYLSHALSAYAGPVGYRSDAYRVLLIFRERAVVDAIIELLRRPQHFIYATLRNAVRSSRLFAYKFLQVARRVGIVSRDAEEVPARLYEAYIDDLPGLEAVNEIFVERLDVMALMSLVEGVSSGRMQVAVKRLARPTALERPVLEEALRADFAFRGLSREALADLVRRRIYSRQVTLLCLNCGWALTVRAALLPDDVRCAQCGFRALAVVKGVDLETAKRALSKFKLRQGMSKEERKVLETLRQSASIVLAHGRLGALVQLAHGVGPRAAIKVLNRVSSGEDLWAAIMEAERQFAATRGFWS
jgi:ATP-dependent Lhr-like helicase